MDVPMAVCTAVMIAKLRPVPPDEHGDLRRENMTSSMTVARSACLEVMRSVRFAPLAADHDIV